MNEKLAFGMFCLSGAMGLFWAARGAFMYIDASRADASVESSRLAIGVVRAIVTIPDDELPPVNLPAKGSYLNGKIGDIAFSFFASTVMLTLTVAFLAGLLWG